ncbi:MAG: D-alanyl-D-alanine carboxypeptidase [Proteobacteria bacterium]|nr:D-alanyl-D-alanine carboxypeptidase [Pseudomonadota bacterium]MCH8187478.1 D-alanyl-D-alanine carboxypeptidase [Pseudomonadota bacterium]
MRRVGIFGKALPGLGTACALIASVLLPSIFLIGVANGQVLGYETSAKQAILVDAETGAVLMEKASDELMHPASMSKLMTVYMVFERLRDGSLKLDDTMRVSEKAWRMGGSKMFVRVDTLVTVEDLLRGVIIQSGNDASIVLAEGLASSEEAFAEAMTRRARELGMNDSVFKNATGWPDPEHLVTSRDMATLAQHVIRDYPEYYPYFAERTFTYNKIKQGNRNPLLYRGAGADGLKTGHTEQSGYGLVASAERNGRRLILVVNGLDSVNARSREAERLLDFGFREFKNYELFGDGETVDEAPVWLGEADTVPLVLEAPLTITMQRKARRNMKVVVQMDRPIPAPVKKGDRVATLVITAKDSTTIEKPLFAAQDVDRRGLIGRVTAAISHLVFGPATN